jgi:hypothetical protein
VVWRIRSLNSVSAGLSILLQQNLKTQQQRITIHDKKGVALPCAVRVVRNDVANIGDVEETEYKQLNFPTLKNSLMSRKIL